MVKTEKSAIWDLKNLRVSIPISKETAERAKKASDDKKKINWELKIIDEDGKN